MTPEDRNDTLRHIDRLQLELDALHKLIAEDNLRLIDDKRQELGLTKADMCRKLGISRWTYVKWQNGVCPNDDTVKKALQL